MKQPRKGGFEAHPLWAVIKTPVYLCCGQLEIYDGKVWITWRLRRKRSASSSQGRRDHLCQHWQLKGTAETENSLPCAQEEVCLLSRSHRSSSCIYIYSGSHLMHRLSLKKAGKLLERLLEPLTTCPTLQYTGWKFVLWRVAYNV